MFHALERGEILLEDVSFHELDERARNSAFFKFSRHDEIEFSVVDFRFGTHSYPAAELLSVAYASD